ncbi:MAG: helix-turn-helix domain-containing protein [Cyclobacteriaceae bacterium]
MRTNKIYARIFRYVRADKQLNQRQLARRLQVNQSTICRIENGLQIPRHVLFSKLQSLTDLSLKELTTRSRSITSR